MSVRFVIRRPTLEQQKLGCGFVFVDLLHPDADYKALSSMGNRDGTLSVTTCLPVPGLANKFTKPTVVNGVLTMTNRLAVGTWRAEE